MSNRVLVLVQRSGGGANVTDKTPTVVWEHEIPILEEIHGEGSCEKLSHNDLLDNEVSVKRKEQIDYIVKTNRLGEAFSGDAFEEYQRLAIKYGMHTEVRVSNVEKVFGKFNAGAFTRACGAYGYEQMTMSELREICDELGITTAPSHKKTDVIRLIRQANDTADQRTHLKQEAA